jgi:hypothetical protein
VGSLLQAARVCERYRGREVDNAARALGVPRRESSSPPEPREELMHFGHQAVRPPEKPSTARWRCSATYSGWLTKSGRPSTTSPASGSRRSRRAGCAG